MPPERTKRTTYDVVVNMRDAIDVHTREIRWIGRGKRVLECGCDTGYVSKVLREDFDCRVTGIEINPEAAEQARAYCEQVIVADLDGFDFAERLAGERFDVILFGDVLEHVRDPWTVLERARDVLEPDGRVIACIPNIAERNVILNLILGRFEYRKKGLLDQTHLRFFTAESARRLLESAGYHIARIERITNPEVEREVPVDVDTFPPQLLSFLRRTNRDWRTIQFLIEAYPATETGTIAALQAELGRTGRETPALPRVPEWDSETEHERVELQRQVRDADERAERLATERDQLAAQVATIATLEDTIVRQQEALGEQLRSVERHWAVRLDHETAVLRQQAEALAASEQDWRIRARDYELYWRRLRDQPLLRVLRRVKRLFGRTP